MILPTVCQTIWIEYGCMRCIRPSKLSTCCLCKVMLGLMIVYVFAIASCSVAS